MRYLQISPLYFLKNTCLKRPTCLFKKANTFHSLLRHCIQKENQRGVFLKKQKNKQEKREVQFMRKKEENVHILHI